MAAPFKQGGITDIRLALVSGGISKHTFKSLVDNRSGSQDLFGDFIKLVGTSQAFLH